MLPNLSSMSRSQLNGLMPCSLQVPSSEYTWRSAERFMAFTGKQVVFSTDGYWTDTSFNWVVVDIQFAICGIDHELRPSSML